MRRNVFICLLLTGLTLAAFWPVGHLGFINYDDYSKDGYIVENPNIQKGINLESVSWAFTTTQASNWHPVTWLSHMLDCQLFDLNPGGHHWVNLGFHIANTLLLFIVLRELTQTTWRSALVAALFGLHPMHVQSVAWVSERKDLLSAFFMMLTLWAYARYALGRSRVESRESRASILGLALVPRRWTLDYSLALFFFALGLMSKPMLVTLPVILLLLDFWPLGRVQSSEFGVQSSELKKLAQLPVFRRLLFEKAPFAALSLASCIVTVWAQGKGGAIIPTDNLPWDWRIENSLTAYVAYLGKLFWPENLVIFYPYVQIPVWEFAGSGLLLILLTVFCVRRMVSQPWLVVGWFWYLVMLLPVIGLVQVGVQSMADRYTYLPSIGAFIIVAWGMAEIASRSWFWRMTMTLGAGIMLAACFLVTRQQLSYWKDSVTLFRHAVEITGDSTFANYYLGSALWKAGDRAGAVKNFRIAIRFAPDFEDAHYLLGFILLQQKKHEAAIAEFNEALQINSNDVKAHMCLGYALAAEKKYTEAEAEFYAASRSNPDNPVMRDALNSLVQKMESFKNLAPLQAALKTQPTPELHGQIAVLQTTQGKFPEAVSHYNEALRLKPDSPDMLNNLAWLLSACPDAQIRDGARAVKLAERACELTHYRITPMVGTLAAAYAEAGRFEEAIATAENACALATGAGDLELLRKNQALLVLYKGHQPYHEPIEEFIPAAP